MADFYYPQSKAYGPAYFMMLSLSYKFFDFGILQTRLPGLIFGFVIAITGFKILKSSGVNEKFCSLFAVVLLLDPIFLQNIHSGRMDSMALMFTFLGILLLIQGLKKQDWLNFIGVGISFGIALLTTPRVAVSIIGPSIALAFFFLFNPSKKLIFLYLFSVFLVVGLYSIWAFWAFGGFPEWYQYLFGQPKVKIEFNSMADRYISGNFYVPIFQIPALITVLLTIVYLFTYKRLFTSFIVFSSMMNMLAFFILVKDTGIYSIFSMPFEYLIIIFGVNELFKNIRLSKISYLIIVSLIFLNGTIFLFKNTMILAYSSSRNSVPVLAQISKVIPKGSRVIGEEIYFYMVHKAGSEFQYLDRGADSPNRRNYHEQVFDYQYVISRNPPASMAEFNYYNATGKFKKVAKICTPQPSKLLISFRAFLAGLGFYFPTGYEGTIYLRQ